MQIPIFLDLFFLWYLLLGLKIYGRKVLRAEDASDIRDGTLETRGSRARYLMRPR
jgi:hypothetical protein